MRNMIDSSSFLLGTDAESFKRQEQVFGYLNLFALAVLLCSYMVFGSIIELKSPDMVLTVVTMGFLIEAFKIVLLRLRTKPPTRRTIAIYTYSTLLLNIGLALILTSATDLDDTQYIILMVVPILEAAVRFSILQTMLVVSIAGFFDFLCVWHFYRHFPHPGYGEYFEAATNTLIFALTGLIVCLLVRQLHEKEMRLSQKIVDLKVARERLLVEEKLAAMGRLSSAIAHEVRNPVAIISSAVMTATQAGSDTALREEMYEIAAREASRLEKLTTDFLTYARPSVPSKNPSQVADILLYVAGICRIQAGEKQIKILVDDCADLVAEVESEQIQRALLNLVMNAIEATAPGGIVRLTAVPAPDGSIRIGVENGAGPIGAGILERIFEPFFTTKERGTGLGLAIARNIARAHGGDLLLAKNDPGQVCFEVILPSSLTVSQTSAGGIT